MERLLSILAGGFVALVPCERTSTSGTYSASIHDRRGFLNIDISGHLTCLRVDGNEAIVSGVVEQTNSGFAPIGSGVIAMGIDNGDWKPRP